MQQFLGIKKQTLRVSSRRSGKISLNIQPPTSLAVEHFFFVFFFSGPKFFDFGSRRFHDFVRKRKIQAWGYDGYQLGCCWNEPMRTILDTDEVQFWWSTIAGEDWKSGLSRTRCVSSAWLSRIFGLNLEYPTIEPTFFVQFPLGRVQLHILSTPWWSSLQYRGFTSEFTKNKHNLGQTYKAETMFMAGQPTPPNVPSPEIRPY